MMLMGVFAAATTLVVAATEIDGIGATNLPTTPKVAFLEPKPEVTKINAVSTAMPVMQKVTYSDPGISEILASMERKASVKTVKTEKVADTDPNRRSAMEFAKDDENSTDWIK
ncbi:MAG: hypothetical protein VXX97_10530 [Pseudomonadota bacterium]|nr:hypothetical protein [Pseudomonadota bacterium]